MLHAVHIHNSYVYEQSEGGVRAYEGGTLGVIRDYMPADCKYIPQTTSTDCIQPDEALGILVERISRSVLEAYDNLEEGGFAQGFGRVAVGMNRRATYSDGSAKMWGDVDRATFVSLEGGSDSGMELLYIFDRKGKMTGVVANVACPAQIMEQRRRWTQCIRRLRPSRSSTTWSGASRTARRRPSRRATPDSAATAARSPAPPSGGGVRAATR